QHVGRLRARLHQLNLSRRERSTGAGFHEPAPVPLCVLCYHPVSENIMPSVRTPLLCLSMFILAAIASAQPSTDTLSVTSPNHTLTMRLVPGNRLQYTVEFRGNPVLKDSLLGLKLEGQAPLGPGMHPTSTRPGQVDETYTIPVGKTRTVRDHYNGAQIDMQDAKGRSMTVEMRAYDDGIAFRMVVPDQAGSRPVRLERELTEFNFSKDAITYPLILDGFQSSYEDEYQVRNVSGLHKEWLIGLPFLANVPGVAWVGITEADIDNYAGMYLQKANERFAVRAQLSPRVDNPAIAVETDGPLTTPWRVLMIGDEPGRLIESNIVLNLNPPTKIPDTSWIKAGKTSWDWWSGDYAENVDFKPGMNTATMKHYIDFSSASGFPYMLIDAGWALANRKSPDDYAAVADITKVDPNIDMPELLRYAKEKNVKLWLWSHWTSVDKYMDQAFPLFEQWGIAGVKIDFMQRDDQQM